MRSATSKLLIANIVLNGLGVLVWLQKVPLLAALAAGLAITQTVAAIRLSKNDRWTGSMALAGAVTLAVDIGAAAYKIGDAELASTMLGNLIGVVTGGLCLLLAYHGSARSAGLIASRESMPEGLDLVLGARPEQGPVGWVTSIRRALSFEPTRVWSNPNAMICALTLLALSMWVGTYIISHLEDLEKAAKLAGNRELAKMLIIGGMSLNDTIIELFAEESALQVMFVLALLYLTPLLAMIMGGDQVASDVGRKHIRFLLPRFRRDHLYVARFLGAWLTWVAAIAPVALGGCLLFGILQTDGLGGREVAFAIRASVVLSLYGLPFIGLMALTNAITKRSSLATLTGFVYWLIISMAIKAGQNLSPRFELLEVLFPTQIKYMIVAENTSLMLQGVALALVYTAVFASMGLWFFKQRDL